MHQFHNLLGPAISAIFAGNGIVLKGSEATAWSSQYYTRILRASLSAHGHSPALIQSLACWPQTASHLTSHPSISHLTFIGSRPIALHVAASASRALTPLCLELGGKDVALVLADTADADRVVSILMRGAFQSAGQNCIGIERVVVCGGDLYAEVVEKLRRRIAALRVGSDLDDEDETVDVGAMISDASFARLERLVADAVAAGARCLVGGKRLLHPRHPKGHYFQPTLLVDVTAEMEVAREECFGPICTVMAARDTDEGIAIANAGAYGLGASVFGESAEELERVTRELRVGMVAVNDFAVYYLCQLPFGGVRGSGYGRFAGEEGLRSLCNLKSVSRDRLPGLVRTTIPGPLQYPIGGARRAWRMCCGIVELGYGETWGRMFGGLWKLISA